MLVSYKTVANLDSHLCTRLHPPLQSPHSFMYSKLSLCLLLHVLYLAAVKAFPASPPVGSLALTPDLRNRADTHFVTIYGLYDNSLRAQTVDSSKPKLAPITEAFMAMTRALATPTVTESRSQSVMRSATPTPLPKATTTLLGQGLAMRPTPVQSSIAPSSTDAPQETLEDLQRAAKTRTHRLVVFGSVIAGVVCLGLLLFLLLDPRMMRKLCGIKVNDNSHFPSKTVYGRPKPTSERGSDTPKIKTSPVRPPRPPTADSPALSESVYLACADQPYVIVAPQPFVDIDRSLDNQPTMPTGPKILSPHDFLNMYAAHSNGSNMNTTLPRARPNPNPTPEFYDTRHSRTYSAPSFVGSMNEHVNNRSEPTVLQRMLKHRRSRSASGWAYPNRTPSTGFRLCN
jgi:hypothetical protein